MSGDGGAHPRAGGDAMADRIVAAFAERARMAGPRSVVMAELAAELGISKRTLHRHFRSKSELMIEVMRRFADDAARAQASRFERRLGPLDRIRETAYGWIETQDRFSPLFWKETRQQYPEAMDVWRATRRRLHANAHERILPDLRPGLPPGLGLALLFSAIERAADPRLCDRLGLSRQESVRHAAEIWARGALRRPDLRVIDGAGGDRRGGGPSDRRRGDGEGPARGD